MTAQLRSFAGSINRIGTAMQKLGIETQYLETVSASFQLIGGSGQVIKGLIAAKEAYNAARAAEGVAQLAKYTVGAGVVAALATAGGIAMGVMIEQAIKDDGAGLRALAGGYANGRGH